LGKDLEMSVLKPACIALVAQGEAPLNTIDVFAVSEDKMTVQTMHFLNGVQMGDWMPILGTTPLTLSSAPAASAAAQAPAVFALQGSGILQNDWYEAASQQVPLGDSTSGPATAMHNDGILSVIAVGYQSLSHVEYDPDAADVNPNRKSWSSVNGVAAPQVVANMPPTLLVWGDNDRMDVFTLGTDSNPKNKTDRAMVWAFGTSWAVTSPTSGWEPPLLHHFQSLGGIFPPGQPGPAVASWGPNRLDVFAVGLNGAMFHKWAEGVIQNADDWHPTYPAWSDLGGIFGSGPAVVSLGPNRLDIFALGSDPDRQMYHKSWDPSRGWTPANPVWRLVGNERSFESAPAVAASAPRLDIFALGHDGQMLHNWSVDMGASWQSTWVPLGTQKFYLGF
jgi:hypothetical protein